MARGPLLGGLQQRPLQIATGTAVNASRSARTVRSADSAVVGRPSPPYIRRAQAGSSASAVPAIPRYAQRGGPRVSPNRAGRLSFHGNGGAVRKSAVSAASRVIRNCGRTAR